jgi:carbon-monoxide dehydrogenase medium subunit
MKPAPFTYARPEGLEEAVALRDEHGGESAILAGGQSLVPMLNMRLARPEVLIDLGGARELAYVQPRDGGVAVGAMARQRDLEHDEHARTANPLIAETLGHVAHSVVRNRGTVVGSIAHADAAAELPTLFVTLDARATAVSARGERTLTGDQLFLFHLTSALEPDELLREVWFPALPASTGWAFHESARRHGDYALAGVCAMVTLAADGTIAQARLGYSGIATRPIRGRAVEEALAGRRPAEEAFEDAGRAAEALVETADDAMASQPYRRHLTHRLTVRALHTAAARASERSADR